MKEKKNERKKRKNNYSTLGHTHFRPKYKKYKENMKERKKKV